MQRENTGRRHQKPSLKLRSDDEGTQDVAVVGWWPATIGAALATAIIGWLLVVAMVLLAWFGLPGVPIADALVAATQLFLVGHGVGAEWSGVPITLTPLGFVIIVCLLASGTAGFAAKQGLLSSPPSRNSERRRLALRTTAVFTIVYAVTIGVLIGFFGSHGIPKRLPVIVLAIAVACFLSVSRTVSYRWIDDLPTWLRPLVGAVWLPLFVIFLAGFVHLLAVVVMNWGTLVEVQAKYETPWLATALLIVIQLLYAPNFAIWLGSLQLGGGFALGTDTLVGIGGSHVGLLPGVPILSGLANAPTTASAWWLLIGVAAGIAAGLLIWRSPYRLRIDETAIVSTGAGIMVALLWLLLAWLSLGSLGVQRMTSLGPAMAQLAFTAIGVVGLSAMAAGVGLGLYQLYQQRQGQSASEAGARRTPAAELGQGLALGASRAGEPEDAAETDLPGQQLPVAEVDQADSDVLGYESGTLAEDASEPDSHEGSFDVVPGGESDATSYALDAAHDSEHDSTDSAEDPYAESAADLDRVGDSGYGLDTHGAQDGPTVNESSPNAWFETPDEPRD